ncbi:DUF2007 domain-containing protein [Zhouia sp. PK063]|uniref:DUF2007 domain-containing protein n=1 Tax=Zhouia sp. PK063 TaxID=3373602 RepID=UPI00379F8179
MTNFVLVEVFTYAHEYMVLKHLMDEENIPYFFENETFLSIHPFYSYALGGIRLKVHKDYATYVKELIDNLNSPDSPLHIV